MNHFLRSLLFLSLLGVQPALMAQEDWQLLWSDEFNYEGAPDPENWSYDMGDGCPNICGWGNNELQFYTDDRSNARVENGHLVIEAHATDDADRPYTSARLVSRGKQDWVYGRVEVRANLPFGRGSWPAIWMLPTERTYGGWPRCGEIDIMEHVGYEPLMVYGTVHTEAYNHLIGTQKGDSVLVQDAEDAFHVYAIEWREDRIDFFVDESLYHTFPRYEDTPAEWPFDQPFHLILNLAVGGGWGGKYGVSESIWPQQMQVDYVRVYQSPSP